MKWISVRCSLVYYADLFEELSELNKRTLPGEKRNPPPFRHFDLLSRLPLSNERTAQSDQRYRVKGLQ